ncbi:MAG: hypothetical protein C4554_02195 [Dethiobacter sp.]|jgi:hypothetical protein|nr:MAG: hypothetical protein C4554_02195 [Dethiobacter sp.]
MMTIALFSVILIVCRGFDRFGGLFSALVYGRENSVRAGCKSKGGEVAGILFGFKLNLLYIRPLSALFI